MSQDSKTLQEQTKVQRPEKDWSAAEDADALGNSKALYALYNGVDKNVFRLINTCTTAKSAWDVLSVAYEGTSKVRNQKLQYLTSKFEALSMYEDETIV